MRYSAMGTMNSVSFIAGHWFVIAGHWFVIAGHDPQSISRVAVDPGSGPISANLKVHIPFGAVAACAVAARRGDGAMFATA